VGNCRRFSGRSGALACQSGGQARRTLARECFSYVRNRSRRFFTSNSIGLKFRKSFQANSR
jgi:hypothetical protein